LASSRTGQLAHELKSQFDAKLTPARDKALLPPRRRVVRPVPNGAM
jgi:hypothetical protein